MMSNGGNSPLHFGPSDGGRWPGLPTLTQLPLEEPNTRGVNGACLASIRQGRSRIPDPSRPRDAALTPDRGPPK
jgi:hypothetical protein